jgi:NAD(P)-dependent dehydrogenase (short-subunit alcohol dehydrogenase family)
VAAPIEGRPVMLITGAARGIGAAVARAAAPTHDLVVNYVASADAAEQVADEARSAGAQVLVHQADVGVEAEVVAMFAATDERFGRLEAVNITGAFICAREAVARMSTAPGGRGGSIVNISSKAAVIGGPDEWIHYAASKGAIDTMTAGLSKEVATEGIRVNSIRPGLIESDFHLHATPGRVERMAPMIPMRRSGTAAEVAAAVLPRPTATTEHRAGRGSSRSRSAASTRRHPTRR